MSGTTVLHGRTPQSKIQEKGLSQVIDRLEALEDEVKTIKVSLFSQPEQYHFEFVIRVDGQEVWAGRDLPKKYPELLHEYPDAQLSIGWRSSPVVLI